MKMQNEKMPCFACEFQITNVNYSRPIFTTVEGVLSAAYKAVNESGIRVRNKHKHLWEKGPECLYIKTRIHAAVVARALCVHYFLMLGWTLRSTGNMFGLIDHTTIIHAREMVNDWMKQRYDSEEKDALMAFKKQLGI